MSPETAGATLAAVEGGGTRFRWGVFEASALLGAGPPAWTARGEVPTTSPDATLDEVARALRPHRPAGLGIASFGPLVLEGAHRGRTLATPKPGWTDVPVGPRLGAALGVAPALETDVNAAAVAEATVGAARGADPVVYVTVGTGVGFGVVVGGRPIHGRLHPEAGHLPMPRLPDPSTGAPDAFPGTCPFHGRCLEGLASGPALAGRLQGDPAACAPDHPGILLAARYLGVGLANAVLLLSPERIVVGGGVGRRPGFVEEARRAVDGTLGDYLPPGPDGPPSTVVVPTSLGDDAGLVGAAHLAAGLSSIAPGPRV